MNCCNDYGQCKQGFGCPVRAMPAECLKAGACQADPCHCETLDKPIAQAESIGFWTAALFFVCLWAFLVALCWQHPILLTQFF